jgi:uncharacterized protein YecT (DUF1311 family)
VLVGGGERDSDEVQPVRTMTLGLVAAVALSVGGNAAADPILECGLMTESAADLGQCLTGQLEVSHGAMEEALAVARAGAQEVDRASGADAAVLGIEASQQAWEAYRDTECKTRAIFAGAGAEAEAGGLELACAIELTRERTDRLLRLAAPRSG